MPGQTPAQVLVMGRQSRLRKDQYRWELSRPIGPGQIPVAVPAADRNGVGAVEDGVGALMGEHAQGFTPVSMVMKE